MRGMDRFRGDTDGTSPRYRITTITLFELRPWGLFVDLTYGSQSSSVTYPLCSTFAVASPLIGSLAFQAGGSARGDAHAANLRQRCIAE